MTFIGPAIELVKKLLDVFVPNAGEKRQRNKIKAGKEWDKFTEKVRKNQKKKRKKSRR